MRFWSRLLLTVTAGSAVFGVSMVLAPGPIQEFFNWLIFGDGDPPAGFSVEALDYLRFVYGVLGAVMAAWMILIAWVVAGPLDRGETWAWNAVAWSVGGWFAIDTSHSLATGYPENAALNCVFIAAFALPLLGARRRIALSDGARARL